jgi:hypothetical protein
VVIEVVNMHPEPPAGAAPGMTAKKHRFPTVESVLIPIFTLKGAIGAAHVPVPGDQVIHAFPVSMTPAKRESVRVNLLEPSVQWQLEAEPEVADACPSSRYSADEPAPTTPMV